jgi:hypothetical protein
MLGVVPLEVIVRDTVNLRPCIYPLTVGQSILWFGLRENDAWKPSTTLCPKIFHRNVYTESCKQTVSDRFVYSGVFYNRGGEHFWGGVPKFSINFEDIFSRTRGNFEVHDKILEYSIIIINYYITRPVINAYYIDIVIKSIIYFISNKDPEEYDKE